MDALSISGAIGGLVTVCARVITTCRDVVNGYQDAPRVLGSIQTECSTTREALSHIFMLINYTDTAPADLTKDSSLSESFNIALTGCTVTFSALDIELNKIVKTPGFEQKLGVRQRAKLIWNERYLKDLMDELRGQREALSLLVTMVQCHSISEMKELLKNTSDVFQNVKLRTDSLHRPPLGDKHIDHVQWNSETFSIFTEQSEKKLFDFDSDILKSQVYKRVYSSVRKAQRPRHPRASSSPLPTNLLEEDDLIDLRDHPPLLVSRSVELTQEVPPLTSDRRLSSKAERLSSSSPGNPTISIITISDIPMSSTAHSILDREIHPALRRTIKHKNLKRLPNTESASQSVTSWGVSAQHPQRMIARSATYDIAHRPVSESESNVEAEAGSSEKQKAHATNEEDVVANKKMKSTAKKIPTASRSTTPVYVFQLMILPKSPNMFIKAAGSGRSEEIRHRLLQTIHLDTNVLEEALFVASLHGHNEIVGMLLLRGLNINCRLSEEVVIRDKGHQYLTPLHLAAAGDSSATLKLLLENGAEVSPKDSLEWTPLHLASARGCVSAVRVLLEYHAPVDSKASLFIEATEPNRVNRTISRLNRAKSILDHVSWTPLFVAAHFGALKTVKALLENGADIHEEPASGFTLLHAATLGDSRYGFHGLNETSIGTWPQGNIHHIKLLSKCPPQSLNHAYLVEYLISRGSNPATPDAFGYTPLHLACLYSFDIACVLIKHTTNVSVKSEFGWTPLHIAALWSSDMLLAQLLVNAGADIEVPLIPPRPPVISSDQQDFGDPYTTCLTPLGLAVAKGNYNMVVQFLKMGARPRMPDSAGTNIVYIAAATGDAAMLILLSTQGIGFSKIGRQGIGRTETPPADRSSVWRASFRRNSRTERKGLLAVDLTVQSSQKFFASEECLPKSRRIDIDTRDQHGYTPLFRLINEVDDVPIRLPALTRLLDLGADPTVFNQNRKHLLHFSDKLETDEIRQLVTAGADLEAKDLLGRTPLHRLARFGQHPAKVELLIALGANIYARDQLGRTVWDHLSARPKSKIALNLFSSSSCLDLTEDHFRSEKARACHAYMRLPKYLTDVDRSRDIFSPPLPIDSYDSSKTPQEQKRQPTDQISLLGTLPWEKQPYPLLSPFFFAPLEVIMKAHTSPTQQFLEYQNKTRIEREIRQIGHLLWDGLDHVTIQRNCTLCGEKFQKPLAYMDHVAQHMEEIAFTAVTTPYTDWDFYTDLSSSERTSSVRSETLV